MGLIQVGERQESKNHTCTRPLHTGEGCEGKEHPATKGKETQIEAFNWGFLRKAGIYEIQNRNLAKGRRQGELSRHKEADEVLKQLEHPARWKPGWLVPENGEQGGEMGLERWVSDRARRRMRQRILAFIPRALGRRGLSGKQQHQIRSAVENNHPGERRAWARELT